MTPTLTPTRWDRVGQNRMLPRPKARKIQSWCMQRDTAERPEPVFKFAKRVDRMKADSKTAGCRFDSCPTCPNESRNKAALSELAQSRFIVCRAFDAKCDANWRRRRWIR